MPADLSSSTNTASASAATMSKSGRGPAKSSRYMSRAPGAGSTRQPMSKLAAASKQPVGIPGRGGRLEREAHVVVRDSEGFDVTPKSLLTKPGAAPQNLVVGGGAELEMLTSMSEAVEQQPQQAPRVQTSHLDTGVSESEDMAPMARGAHESSAIFDGREASGVATVAAPSASAPAPAAEQAPLTEEELKAPVTVELRETETIWLFSIAGSQVAMDSADAAATTEQNKAYEALLRARVDMSDMFVERGAQTFHGEKKMKDVQTPATLVADAGCQANAWDIYDAASGGARLGAAEGEAGAAHGGSADGAADYGGPLGGGSGVLGSGVDESSVSGMGMSSTMMGQEQSAASGSLSQLIAGAPGGAPAAEGGAPGTDERKEEGGKRSQEGSLRGMAGLPAALRVVERVAAQNSYHEEHLAYRNIMQAGDKTELKRLWGFECAASAGRNVSCVEWNPENPDMLAVGYGEFDFSRQGDGMLLFWSLKNPTYPDKIIATKCGVTSIAFSRAHPNLLAAGLYDGTVCIYDVRKTDQTKPMLASGHTSGKHSDPVWGLKWVDQGAERGEVLVSISTDGRITQWNMKKGLEHTVLMVLKRVTATAKHGAADGKDVAAAAGSEGIISRRASGLCFDFCPKDSNLYVAGTEDGHLHKCSCSYNEQHLDNYFGHAGPVYQLRWSPFCANTFISCSADWTIKLWDQEHSSPIFSFQSTTDYVSDICWSPTNSTIFAAVTGDGRVDVWDISANTLDPVQSVQTDRRLTTVKFAPDCAVLVTGNDAGAVEVYQLSGSLAESTGRTQMQQVAALDKVTSTVHDGA